MTTQLANSRPLIMHAKTNTIVICAPEVTKRAQLRQMKGFGKKRR